jgi:site-specific DNA-methyltransferase (adenine-specific)
MRNRQIRRIANASKRKLELVDRGKSIKTILIAGATYCVRTPARRIIWGSWRSPPTRRARPTPHPQPSQMPAADATAELALWAPPEAPYEVQAEDCLKFLRGLPSASVDLIVTDPAYSGMNQHLQLGRGRIVGVYRAAGQAGAKWFTEFHDDPETYRIFLQECHRVLREDRHIYIMFDSFSMLTLAPLVREVFSVKNILVWDKVNMGMGHYFRRRHELILFASKGHRKLRTRDRSDVITAKRIYRAAYPTQKPVAVFDAMVQPSVEPGFVVCDPFVGAGAAGIAALKADCAFMGADLSRRAVSITRWRLDTFAATGDDPLEGPNALRLPARLE